ncbi:MAG: response regulator [Betaproteobacteria bacterium]|nr:response regulator [Betaproteobacteria bacterium]
MGNYEQVEILLVEDKSTDAELTLRALKRHNLANRVLWVKDGQEALDYVFAAGAYAERSPGGDPKLILLDIKLPRISGVDVLRRLKGDERTKSIPVTMLTSSAEERDVIESYQLGVNSYIVKPVDFNKFVETVSEVGMYWMVVNRPPT